MIRTQGRNGDEVSVAYLFVKERDELKSLEGTAEGQCHLNTHSITCLSTIFSSNNHITSKHLIHHTYTHTHTSPLPPHLVIRECLIVGCFERTHHDLCELSWLGHDPLQLIQSRSYIHTHMSI